MTAITSMNKQTRDALERAMIAAFNNIAERFDLDITTQGYRYDNAGKYFEPKFRVSVRNDEGEAHNPDAESFRLSASFYGLDPDDLGKVFYSRRVAYKITGLKGSRPKYPISADRVTDGHGFKFPAEMVKSALRKAA